MPHLMVLRRPYVLPERYTFPLVDAQNFGIEMPQGMLFVKLIEATGVPRMDLFSKSDPFVKRVPGCRVSGHGVLAADQDCSRLLGA